MTASNGMAISLNNKITQPAKLRLFHLDVVRGIAILLILGYHTPATIRIHPLLDTISDAVHVMGHCAVDLFFVLSGFLIGGLLFREIDQTGTINVRRFLIRRAFKIWPAYLICLMTTCVTMAAVGKEMAEYQHPYLTLTQDMWPAALHIQNYYTSTYRCAWFWSLAVEEHFYILLPLCLLWLYVPSRRNGTGLTTLLYLSFTVAIACLALRGRVRLHYSAYSAYTHLFPTHLRIDSLMAGVALSAATRYASSMIKRLSPWRWWMLAAAIGILLAPVAIPGFQAQIYPLDATLFWAAGMSIVLCAHYADQGVAMLQRMSWASLTLTPIAWCGQFSYSIYLWHGYFAPPFSARLMKCIQLPLFSEGVSSVAHLCLYFGVAFMLGIASYYFIEMPFLRIRDRFCDFLSKR